MAVLLDTSILCRLANRSDVDHQTALDALATLASRGETLHITPQNLVEFRNVATRQVLLNGLGFSAPIASQLAAGYEQKLSLLEDGPGIHPTWRAIVDGLGIIGKTVHDARVVAVCHVHGVIQVLTFNVNHFMTLAGFGPGIGVLNPRSP